MVANASSCRAVAGVSCFFTSDSKESLVWNDWYSVGVVDGHMVSTSVDIYSWFR
jgi:hypothetical protein